MTKYVNNNGVSEMWLNIKNWVTSQLLGKSDVGHTHSASDITSGLSTVATSGSYNDLSNKPTIPSKTSDLTNDSGFITSDNTKIPLAGSNQISGSLIPATDNSIDIGSSTKNIKMLYTKGITINGTKFLPSDYIPRSGGVVLEGQRFLRTVDDSTLNLYGSTDFNNGACLQLAGKDNAGAGQFFIRANNGSTSAELIGKANGTLTWGSKNVAMQEDTVPRGGGVVITGSKFSRTVDDSELRLDAGSGWNKGGTIVMFGKDHSIVPGQVQLHPSNGTDVKNMSLNPDGTWTWQGTAVQLISDQRLKQQIAQIDDDLLTAWEDVNPVQFKYNDAVEQKGKDKARLHTGYVVQQIDEACKKHNVDVSKYGLYCHEEYAEETREVEQADGTKKTEVVRPANEHYSLRYTEALIVECAYLRKCIKELRNEIEQLKSSK